MEKYASLWKFWNLKCKLSRGQTKVHEQLEISDFTAEPFETAYKYSSSTSVQSHVL